MTLIQILAIGIVVLILIKTTSDFKKKRFTLFVFLSWLLLWAIVLTVAVHPQVTNFLAKLLGVNRGTDLAIYFSIIFIFFMIFRIIISLEKIEREITEIVRHIAFKNKSDKN